MASPLDGLFEIRIVVNDRRTLSSEFEGDLLQVTRSGGFHDLSTDEGASGEGDLFNLRVLGDGLTDCRPVAEDNVDYAWWETSFFD